MMSKSEKTKRLKALMEACNIAPEYFNEVDKLYQKYVELTTSILGEATFKMDEADTHMFHTYFKNMLSQMCIGIKLVKLKRDKTNG